jgi:hypothetical protein
MELITDRTQTDVNRAKELNKKVYDAFASVAAASVDADALIEPMAVIEATLTEAEFAEWKAGLKGAYNHTDLNRVGQAVQEIGAMLKSLPDELESYRKAKEVYYNEKFLIQEYDSGKVSVDPKLGWKMTDPVTPAAAAAYLKDIANLRSILPDGCPAVPSSLAQFTYSKANEIEKILQTVHKSGLGIADAIKAKIDQAALNGTDWDKYTYTAEEVYASYATQSGFETTFDGQVDEKYITGYSGYTTEWVDIEGGKRECHYVPRGNVITIFAEGSSSATVYTFPDDYTVRAHSLFLNASGPRLHTRTSTITTTHTTRTIYNTVNRVGTVHTEGYAYPDGITYPIIDATYAGEPLHIIGGGYYYIRIK